MGFRSTRRDVHVVAAGDKASESAKEAWAAGEPGFVYRYENAVQVSGEVLTVVLNSILAVGWQLHSTTAVRKQVGRVNMEVVIFTFLRPS